MQFDDFLSFLDLLKNPDQYEAKVVELAARNQAIQDSIAQLGVASDIVKAQAKTENLLAKAQETLDKATTEAEQIISTAQKSFDERYADLLKREAAADEAMTTFRNQKMTWGARAEEHRAKEQQLHNLEKNLLASQAEMASKQAEVDARLEKLRQAMG